VVPLLASVMCLGFGFRCLHKKIRNIDDEICRGVLNDSAAIVMIVFGVGLLFSAYLVHRFYSRKKDITVENMEETGPFNVSQTDELLEDSF
jgi:hypothetical protein